MSGSKWRPPAGVISADRVAISGTLGILDLYEGGNVYYQKYMTPTASPLVEEYVDHVASMRTTLLGKLSAFLYVVIPNKASCLPENYPIWLPNTPTKLMSGIRNHLSSVHGNVFCDWMTQGLWTERRNHWLETDSHWNAFGAYRAAQELLGILGVSLPPPSGQRSEENWGGDLSGRWGMGFHATEDRVRLYWDDSVRSLISDNGLGQEHSANTGRFLHWHNPAAVANFGVAIIGDSFSGTGLAPEHMTYWITNVFKDVFFLHSSSIPVDFLDHCPIDMLIFQTNERFLAKPQTEARQTCELTSSFVKRTGVEM